MASEITLRIDRPANDGQGVGRDEAGRTVFCEGALPGEVVAVQLVEEKKRFARGVVGRVLDASPERIVPVCKARHEGCGGCDMAHATDPVQRTIKAHVVRDALSRIGRFDDATIDAAWKGFADTPTSGWYRTTARFAVANGRLGYRQAKSHSTVHPAHCRVVHPNIDAVISEGRFPDSAGPEVVVRTSAATGETIVVLDGVPDGVTVPGRVEVTTRTRDSAGRGLSITEEAAGRSWTISGESFFQAGPGVATALVDAVSRAAGDLSGSRLVDAYCGVGLFAGTVGRAASELIAIEVAPSSVRDLRRNLDQQIRDGQPVDIVESRVESWQPTPADVVIADPARAGLGADGVRALVQTNAERFVLVSCDTGSFGRDAGLLRDAGYELESIELVDAFRDTSHVEVITAFSR